MYHNMFHKWIINKINPYNNNKETEHHRHLPYHQEYRLHLHYQDKEDHRLHLHYQDKEDHHLHLRHHLCLRILI